MIKIVDWSLVLTTKGKIFKNPIFNYYYILGVPASKIFTGFRDVHHIFFKCPTESLEVSIDCMISSLQLGFFPTQTHICTQNKNIMLVLVLLTGQCKAKASGRSGQNWRLERASALPCPAVSRWQAGTHKKVWQGSPELWPGTTRRPLGAQDPGWAWQPHTKQPQWGFSNGWIG